MLAHLALDLCQLADAQQLLELLHSPLLLEGRLCALDQSVQELVSVFLNGRVNGLSLQVFEREAEVPRHHVLLFAVVQMVVQFLQLVHEVVDHHSAPHLHPLYFFWGWFAEHHVSEVVDHEELLEYGVDVADCAQVLNPHETLPDQTLL